MRRFNIKDIQNNLHLIEAEFCEFDDNGTITFLNGDDPEGLVCAFANGGWSAVFVIQDMPINNG